MSKSVPTSPSNRIVDRILEGSYGFYVKFFAFVIPPLVELYFWATSILESSFEIYGHRIVRKRDGSVVIYSQGGGCHHYTQREWSWNASTLRDLILLGEKRSLSVQEVASLYGAGVISKGQIRSAQNVGNGVIHNVHIGDNLYDLTIVETS